MFKSFAAALAALFLLSACGGSATIPRSAFQDAMRSPKSNCPAAPTPGTAEPATITMALPTGQNLLVGQPANFTVTLYGYDSNGQWINGNFKSPVTMHLTGIRPGAPSTELSCSTIYASGQTTTLSYDGRVDIVRLTGTANGRPLSNPGSIATLLPYPSKVHGGALGWTLQFDAKGNLWTESDWGPNRIAIESVDQNLNVHTFVDPNKRDGPGGSEPFVDRGGNVWTGYRSSTKDQVGVVRLDAATKHFSSYALPKSLINVLNIDSISQDKFGTIWLTTSSDVLSAANYIVALKGNAFKLVATVTDPPYNLTADPKGRGMWFSAGTKFYNVRGDGTIRSVNLGSVSGIAGAVTYALGPDNNWWVPYPFERKVMIKVSLDCSIVSRKPIPYLKGEVPDVNGWFARDSTGNLFQTDRNGDGLIRYSPDGHIIEVKSAVGGDDTVEGIAAAKDGTLYVIINGGIAKLDPHLWM